MDLQVQEKPQKSSCLNCQSINDENNNLQNSICTNCEHKNQLEEKKNERMMIVPDTSSDDEYWCSSCSSINDSELISIDTRKLWHDIAHIIKCIYRETNREFAENHSTNDICKAKECVQILTQLDSESLFNKVESIVLEYVDEIRNQVLKRFQTCLKTSNDVQLFISYLLDEYNTFIQAAKNVATIVSYLEEHYMKSFHLTWLLYNKHLYEKLVYMDKKIQHSMSTMIDLLQPSNDNNNDYSPAEYTQLLNRFLAFDEEMSEIACLYKDCQTKMTSISRNSLMKNRKQMGIIVQTKKKKICKKTKRIQNTLALTKDNLNSSTTNAVNIPVFSNSTTTPTASQQGSNGSSIGSGIGGKESSSISSFDEYLLDNNISSSSYTKEESDRLISTGNNNDLHEQLCHEIDELKLTESTRTTDDNEEKQKTIINDNVQASRVPSTKKSKSSKSSSKHRKESSKATSNTCSLSLPKSSLTPDLIFPPKPPSSTTSKFQADFRPLSIPLLTKTEMPTCPSLLSAKIQSVSFTAGTFGSITTNESSHLSSNNQTRLSINLSRRSGPSIKADATSAYNNLDQLLRQAASHNEISALLSSLESTEPNDETQRSSSNDKNCDFCCCDFFPESNSSATHGCVTCMSLPNPATITCAYNQRDIEVKERLKLKLTKRTVQNVSDQAKPSTGNKSKTKPCDNNIDDLVRFIDGNETTCDGLTSKKNKKKKDKQMKINPLNEDTNEIKQNKPTVKDLSDDIVQPLSKRKRKAKSKLEQQEKQDETSSIVEPPTTLTATPPSPKKTDSIPIKIDPSTETSIPPEEEVNWITISRKQTKHKPTPTPASSANTQPKRQQTTNKTKSVNTSNLVQQKVIPELMPNSNKQQHIPVIPPPRVQNPMKTHTSQQQKSEPPSAWATHEQIQVTPSSTLLATAPAFVPASSLLTLNKSNDVLPLEEPALSLYWDPDGYLLPPGPVQRPTSSFSPAPGSLNTTTSRCIQRPSSEPRTTSFPVYSPMNYSVDNSTSAWTDTPATNPTESQWKYSHEEQFPTSTIPNDFPLYDPFNSGAGLTMPSSTLLNNPFEEHFGDLHISQNNDIDEMDALDKEIEDFKKSYIDNVLLNPREKVQINNDQHNFIRQS